MSKSIKASPTVKLGASPCPFVYQKATSTTNKDIKRGAGGINLLVQVKNGVYEERGLGSKEVKNSEKNNQPYEE